MPGNRLVVGPEEALYSSALIAGQVKWVSSRAPYGEFRCEAKVRYRSAGAEAVVLLGGERVIVRFREPQRAVTPGQAVVLYRGEEVIGGGIIGRALGRAGPGRGQSGGLAS